MPPTESEAHAIRVARVVVVVTSVRVDIVEVRRVARIRRTEPPIAGSACENIEQPLCCYETFILSHRDSEWALFFYLCHLYYPSYLFRTDS